MGFNFIREIILKFTREIPVKFRGISLIISLTFRLILKKCTLEGVFEFFHPDPNLSNFLNPIENLSGHFFYICISFYGCSV